MLLTQEPREVNVALKFYDSGKSTLLERQYYIIIINIYLCFEIWDVGGSERIEKIWWDKKIVTSPNN